MKRSYQLPIRVGEKLFIDDLDGVRREVDVLTFIELARMWNEAATGLAVYLSRPKCPMEHGG